MHLRYGQFDSDIFLLFFKGGIPRFIERDNSQK